VIRTIWLASFGLALLGALFAVKVTSAPIPEATAFDGPGIRKTALLGDACSSPDRPACAAAERR
jgi:hypothetical protein